ncbi:major tail protein [Aneurinibacillus sp. REN35]|uniref:major tail protein n=1 Tax=Aneurinibacillus sp. REN35 TaxID=3237286 RepID=UPI00352718B5
MAGVRVGLKDLHYALLTKDDATGVTYSAPKKIIGAITANVSPTTNTETLYADDGPSDVATALGEITVELNVKDLPLETQAELLGHTLGSDGVLLKNADDQAPYVAIGFRSKKSNGKDRFVWLFKGKFQPNEEEYQTREDSPSFQTPTIEGTFVKREFDGNWQAIGDEDATGFTAATAQAWFTKVYETPVA